MPPGVREVYEGVKPEDERRNLPAKHAPQRYGCRLAVSLASELFDEDAHVLNGLEFLSHGKGPKDAQVEAVGVGPPALPVLGVSLIRHLDISVVIFEQSEVLHVIQVSGPAGFSLHAQQRVQVDDPEHNVARLLGDRGVECGIEIKRF